MASPQKEDGHLRIANELIEAFQWLHLSGNQWQLLWTILRFTCGWNKNVDNISLTSFEKHTGISRRNFKRDLDVLFSREIIVRDSSSYINQYGLQKDYTKWQTGIKNDTSIKNNTSIKNDTATSIKNDTKTSIKNNTHKRQKTIKDIYSEEFLEFWGNYPSRNGKKLNKKKCFSLFNLLNNQERKEVNAAAKNYARSKRVLDGFITDPEGFLKDKYWREWIEPETKPRRFDEIGH